MNDFTDIRRDAWVLRLLPGFARPYARLMRLDRPIGVWLLLLPGWWSIALAAANEASSGALPDAYLLLLFGIGAVIMRGAGCTVNDLWDRNIDAAVERTRNRPIPSGEVSVKQATIFLIAQLLAGLAVLLQLSPTAIWLGVASLLLVGTYPLMKRITWWPQAFLGLTFNWGALMGWASVTDDIALPAILLYAAGVFWTLAYDTIYAFQDIEDDARIGVRSTARLLTEKGGRRQARAFVAFCYAGFAGLSLAALVTGGAWPAGVVGWLAATALILWIVGRWQPDDQDNCLAMFKANRFIGWALMVGIIIGALWSQG